MGKTHKNPNNPRVFCEEYAETLIAALKQVDKEKVADIISLFADCRKNGRKIFIIGNGGSASTSSHFANDLNKLCSIPGKKRFFTLALGDNTPLMTAWANDSDYSAIFSEQLKNFMQKGDVCFVMSCSGNSRNLLSAVECCRELGGTSIALLGRGGGKLKGMVDKGIVVESDHYGIIEDTHLSLCHMIANCIKEMLDADAT